MILTFTTDEVWEHYPTAIRNREGRPENVQLAGWPELSDFMPNLPATAREEFEAFKEVLALRETVTKALEDARNAGEIVKSQEADVAIVFEGCPADDTVVPECEVQTAIHKGPMLRHIDARMITNPRYQRFALDLGAALGIPVQEAVRTGGSTNGAPIHLSNLGVPCIVIGFPVRYIHSPSCVGNVQDFEAMETLIGAFLEKMEDYHG